MAAAFGVGVLVLCGACSSRGTSSAGSPSTLAALSVPTSSSSQPTSPNPSTQSPVTQSPIMQSAQMILSTVAARAANSCDATSGTGSIQFEHDPAAADVLRQMTVIVDGRQVSPPLVSGQTITSVDGVICDGAVHTVVVVAVGRDGSSPSRAFAVLMPR